MSGLEIYLMIVLPLHVIDEAYHCNNIPYTGDDNDKHIICNWAEDDYEYFITEEGVLTYQLKKDCKDDNYFEKRARDKHWEQRRLNE